MTPARAYAAEVAEGERAQLLADVGRVLDALPYEDGAVDIDRARTTLAYVAASLDVLEAQIVATLGAEGPMQ